MSLGIGQMLGKFGFWIGEKLQDFPVIGSIIKAGKHLKEGNWAKALTAFSRMIPGVGWLLDYLGMTEDVQTTTYENLGTKIKELWDWIKDSFWEKIDGLFGGLIDGVKGWWENLSLDPRTWIGIDTKTLPATPPLPNPPGMKDGGVVSATPGGTVIRVAEGGEDEAIVPKSSFEKFFNTKDIVISNLTLKDIASNTKDTYIALKTLNDNIVGFMRDIKNNLAQNKQQGNSNYTVISPGRQNDYTSASVTANTNFDPIRAVRAQFV